MEPVGRTEERSVRPKDRVHPVITPPRSGGLSQDSLESLGGRGGESLVADRRGGVRAQVGGGLDARRRERGAAWGIQDNWDPVTRALAFSGSHRSSKVDGSVTEGGPRGVPGWKDLSGSGTGGKVGVGVGDTEGRGGGNGVRNHCLLVQNVPLGMEVGLLRLLLGEHGTIGDIIPNEPSVSHYSAFVKVGCIQDCVAIITALNGKPRFYLKVSVADGVADGVGVGDGKQWNGGRIGGVENHPGIGQGSAGYWQWNEKEKGEGILSIPRESGGWDWGMSKPKVEGEGKWGRREGYPQRGYDEDARGQVGLDGGELGGGGRGGGRTPRKQTIGQRSGGGGGSEGKDGPSDGEGGGGGSGDEGEVLRKVGAGCVKKAVKIPVQKYLFFDGRGSWSAYRRQFERVWRKEGLSEEDARELLDNTLRESAQVYYSDNIPGADSMPVSRLLDRLEKRFRPKLPVLHLEGEFAALEQREGESLVSWHERVESMGNRAFEENSVGTKTKKMVQRFCLGLLNKKVGDTLFSLGLTDLEEALDRARVLVPVYGGQKGGGIRKGVMTVGEEEGGVWRVKEAMKEGEEQGRGSQVNAVGTPADQPWAGLLESIVEKLVVGVSEAVKAAKPEGRPFNRPFPGLCYSCDEYGHIRRDCPQQQGPWKSEEQCNAGRGRGRGRPLNGGGSAT